MDFLLATQNKHKEIEFNELFDKSDIKIKSAPKKIPVEENGNSFLENAHLKAKTYYDEFHCPILSDDSGLVVEKLPDQLGIHSARFGGEGKTDRERAELLLQKLKGTEKSERSAYFVCVLCFYFTPDEIYYFEGRVDGIIAESPSGEHGFGYDPVFVPSGAPTGTLADNPVWKSKNCHRATAVKLAQQFFKERNCQNP